jgi:hypothetical protein
LVSSRSPLQSRDMLFDYVQQRCVDRQLTMNGVAFCPDGPEAESFLRMLAEETGGRYHFFSATEAGSSGASSIMCSGDDIDALTHELVLAQEVLDKLESMSADFETRKRKYEESKVLPTWMVEALRTGEYTLNVDTRAMRLGIPKRRFVEFTGPALSSADWLRENGLQARTLTIYDALESETVTPPVRAEGAALTDWMISEHAHIMDWRDGRTRYVRVHTGDLESYERAVQEQADLYVARMSWLLSGSRETFGVVTERRACFLLDVSARMHPRGTQLLQVWCDGVCDGVCGHECDDVMMMTMMCVCLLFCPCVCM